MTRDRLDDAFLRLRAAAHADEYVPMENVIEFVLAENARLRAEAEQADEEATTLANSDLATTEQVVRALRAENERLRAALRDIRERARTDHVLRFDDGSILLADFITEVLEKEKP
jgi:hypothetical protein